VAPGLVPVCPAVTARQLSGFGLCQNALAVKPGDILDLGQRRLRFLAYPSEMHLWEGLIAYEETDKILFTSDLFIRRGQPEKPLVDGKRAEFQDIPAMSIPSPEGRQACLESIKALDIRIMALGHGPAVQIAG
jgi:flavorubredoxin